MTSNHTFVRSMASFGPSAHTVTNSVKPLVSRSRTLYRACGMTGPHLKHRSPIGPTLMYVLESDRCHAPCSPPRGGHPPARRPWPARLTLYIDHQVSSTSPLAAESSFWAGVLDGEVDAEDDWHMVIVEGEPRIGIQLAPNHVPPDWPDGTPEQQIHLDLWVDDFPSASGPGHGAVQVLPACRQRPPHNPGLRGSGRASFLPVLDRAVAGAPFQGRDEGLRMFPVASQGSPSASGSHSAGAQLILSQVEGVEP